MKISYNYEEIIEELKADVSDNILSLTDNIQILRSNKAINNDYKPIIDWYYNNEIMEDNFKIDVFYNEQDIKEKNNIKEQYKKDKEFLENISVENCLIEMEEKNRII